MVQQKFIPLPEVARRLALPYRAVWELYTSRRLDGERRGGRYFVTIASVEEIEKAHAAEAEPAEPRTVESSVPPEIRAFATTFARRVLGPAMIRAGAR